MSKIDEDKEMLFPSCLSCHPVISSFENQKRKQQEANLFNKAEITSYDYEFAKQMEIAEESMKENKDVLKKLAE